jgi:hypothetical protein
MVKCGVHFGVRTDFLNTNNILTEMKSTYKRLLERQKQADHFGKFSLDFTIVFIFVKQE